jgi:genome maintenance exonuclease 1
MITEQFNYQQISRVSVEGKRHYSLPDGSRVPSVTTILDATKPDEKRKILADWRKRVGPKLAQEITVEAAGRGTRMHKWLETYVKEDNLGVPGTNPFSRQSHAMANVIIFEGLANNVTEYWGVEVPVYYSGLYAGTTDCVGLWKGQPAILDFKQTNKPKKREWIEDYFLQLAAYALAHNHTHNTKIETGVILMCSAAAPHMYQEFVIEGTEFAQCTDLWLERVESYYKLN